MPNLFAFLVLWSWPLAVYLLFRHLRRDAALVWSVLGGYLLLPTRAGLDLPALPTIDKDGLPILSAALMILLGVGGAVAGQRARHGVGIDRAAPPPERGKFWFRLALFVLLVVSPLATALTNSDPVVFGVFSIPGMRLYDAASIFAFSLVMLLPYILGRRYLHSAESQIVLLKALVLGMAAYTLPMLYEIRMSPQLNVMFYGFFPHEFLQHMRAGGYRPLVFLVHGLWLAILMAMAILSAVALWRARMAEGARAGQWFYAAVWLLVVLFLSNSLGALAIAAALLPVPLLLGTRAQLWVAAVLAAAVLFYPVLRSSQMLPTEVILDWAGGIDAERADSLQFRLDNEDALSARAAEKPVAGWGTWGRNMIYDPQTGQNITVTDGMWIIVIGNFGWLGYLAQFGLLTLPVILMALRRRGAELGPATGGLALVLAANLVDLIPNATLTPVTWLVAGALAGRYAYGTASDGERAAIPPAIPRRSWSLVTDRKTDGPQPEPRRAS